MTDLESIQDLFDEAQAMAHADMDTALASWMSERVSVDAASKREYGRRSGSHNKKRFTLFRDLDRLINKQLFAPRWPPQPIGMQQETWGKPYQRAAEGSTP